MAHAGQIQRRIHRAQIDHFQLRAELTCQHADRRAAADKVEQHLPGDFLRISRYAFGYHAMVASENRDPDLIQRWLELTLQTGQLHGHRFKAPQRTGRFGQLLLALGRLRDDVRVHGFARVQPPGRAHNAGPFKVRGRPATVRTTR